MVTTRKLICVWSLLWIKYGEFWAIPFILCPQVMMLKIVGSLDHWIIDNLMIWFICSKRGWKLQRCLSCPRPGQQWRDGSWRLPFIFRFDIFLLIISCLSQFCFPLYSFGRAGGCPPSSWLAWRCPRGVFSHHISSHSHRGFSNHYHNQSHYILFVLSLFE